jgi:hypothetical protein
MKILFNGTFGEVIVPIFTEPVSVGNSNCIFLSFYTLLTFFPIQKEVIFDLKRENQFFVKRDIGVNTLQKRLAGVGTVKTSFCQKRYHGSQYTAKKIS